MIDRRNGLDVLFKNKWGPYSLWTAYSFAEVENQFGGINGGAFFPATQDIRHRLVLSQTFSLPKWEFSANFNISTGKPYTEPAGIIQTPIDDPDPEDPEFTYQVDFSQIHNERLDIYHRLDISANYKIRSEKMRGKAGISIINAYNRDNVITIENTLIDVEEENEWELFEIERLSLGFTPNLFFQLEF